MIVSVWKPYSKYFDKKRVFTHYEKVSVDDIFNTGTTGYKVIWKCDKKSCKTPDKLHSISRCHLNKDRSDLCNEEIQICHPCQFTGKGNPRYGDNRTWDDIMGKEKSEQTKKTYRENFIINNPSKRPEVKIKKGQMVINFENVSKYVTRYGYNLNNIDGENKFCKLYLTCNSGHFFEIRYVSFQTGHRCQQCYFDSIKIDESDVKKFEKYMKIVRYKTRTTFRRFKQIIDPNNLKGTGYHIDHIYSVLDGFKNNVDPNIISSHVNLRVIPEIENLKKGSKSEMTLDLLLEKFYSSSRSISLSSSSSSKISSSIWSSSSCSSSPSSSNSSSNSSSS